MSRSRRATAALRYAGPAALAVALAALIALCWRVAWLSDDGYITLRVVDNLLHGHGLRWNVADRVQAYTNPLWLAVLVIPYAITRETLFTVSALGIALTLIAVGLLVGPLVRARRWVHAFALVALLCGSKSLLCYATAGLENGLGLLVLAALVADERPPSERRAALACLLVSLAALTRADLVLVAAPVALVRLRGLPRSAALRAIAIGAAPLAAWELFSLFYYGALVPNTAYAKLHTGVPRRALWLQGIRYYQSLERWDPLGAAVLFAGVGVGLLGRARPLALGLAVYGVYLVAIGGDFMCGRFFMIPIALAAYLLCDSRWPGRAPLWIALLPALIFLADDRPPRAWLRGDGPPWSRWGIVDERAFYYAHTGLFHPQRARDLDQMYYSRFGRRLAGQGVVEETCVGMVGFYAGPTVHLVDAYALGDALLARLPVRDPTRFRPGHFERAMPAGYLETLRSGQNRIQDAELAAYWDGLGMVVRGPLWSGARLRALASLLLGRYDKFLDGYVARVRPAP